MPIYAVLCAVFMRYAISRTINELEYFTGKDVYIKLAGFDGIHLAYSKMDNSFKFVNSYTDPSIFAYDDRARIGVNGNKFELFIGGVQACLQKTLIVRCDSSDPKKSSLFKISKDQFGFEIANGDMCVTKDMDTKVSTKKCVQQPDQIFEFVLSGSLGCRDAEEQHDVRLRSIERDLGELMHRTFGWRGVTYYPDGLQHAPYYDREPGIMRMDGHGEGTVQGPLYEYPGERFVHEPAVHDYPGDRFVHEQTIHEAPLYDHALPPVRETQTVIHETEAHPRYVQPAMLEPVHHAVIHTEERPVVVNRPVVQDQLHSEKTKIIPGKTTVETKTVPVKMRVRTQMAPTTQTVVTETVADQEVVNDEADVSYDEETDVEDVNSL